MGEDHPSRDECYPLLSRDSFAEQLTPCNQTLCVEEGFLTDVAEQRISSGKQNSTWRMMRSTRRKLRQTPISEIFGVCHDGRRGQDRHGYGYAALAKSPHLRG